jgi:hypothetical protein
MLLEGSKYDTKFLPSFINPNNDEVSPKTQNFNGRKQVETLFTKIPNPFCKKVKRFIPPLWKPQFRNWTSVPPRRD